MIETFQLSGVEKTFLGGVWNHSSFPAFFLCAVMVMWVSLSAPCRKRKPLSSLVWDTSFVWKKAEVCFFFLLVISAVSAWVLMFSQPVNLEPVQVNWSEMEAAAEGAVLGRFHLLPLEAEIKPGRVGRRNVTDTQLNGASVTHHRMSHWRETTPITPAPARLLLLPSPSTACVCVCVTSFSIIARPLLQSVWL